MNSEAPKPRRATAWQAVKAVFWAFFGVRKNADYERDAVSLSPVQVIVIGIIATILFVLGLLVLVRYLTS